MTIYPETGKLEKFVIMNFLEIIELIGSENERIISMFTYIRRELDKKNIIDNMVIITDDRDTDWMFNIYKQDGEFYYLEFTGTAK